MNAHIIRTLIAKDLRLYFRNRFFAFITIAGVILYIVIYALLPATVDEALRMAVYAPTIPPLFLDILTGNDITIDAKDSDEALRTAVQAGEYPAGIVLTGDVITGLLSGQAATVTVYVASDAPREIVEAMTTVLRLAFNELSYTLSGNPLRLELTEQIIGPDMTGQQIAARSRLLPLMAIMLLVLETMGLGSLIADERETGTLTALLVTPVTVPGLFTAKAIFGVTLAFVQAALLMGLTGNLRVEPALVLLTLLLGGVVVTGLAFLIASVSKSMLSVMAWGILLVIVMMIPSYGVVFPGMASGWVQLIPSYYLFDTIHQVTNFGASWAAVGGNLVILFAIGVGLLAAGVVVMERKLR